MNSYESARLQYKPTHIKILLVAESPPPEASIQSSRQFYYTDRIRKDDRLFTNTIRALYPETLEIPEQTLQEEKASWLHRFASDGFYMIEALEESQVHEVTKKQRQNKITQSVPRLIERVKELAEKNTKLILIKSNVFEAAAEPLKDAGFTVLNKALLDYPGRYNQRPYREKLSQLVNGD